ncbi:transcriptional regulator [Rhodococcus sp. OAS809]|uniref:FMN-binding negative transcriptional regulator n=1 Tax=Rhodococcus sp. OAS809 TaxID=2663874 RepID=UPI00178B539B
MILPGKFRLSDEAIDASLRAGGFGHLITPGPESLEVTSIPLRYNAENHSVEGHIARANPHWRYANGGETVIVLPATDAYVSPDYYPSKRVHGKVVPTWNYEVLYIYGQLVTHDDDQWLREHVTALTTQHESGRQKQWTVTDAPKEFIDAQLRGIVGFELQIDRVYGKAKMNQNRSPEDRSGVIRGLEQGTHSERETAAAMIAAGLDEA